MPLRYEPEVLTGLRAFPTVQEMLRGVPLRTLPDTLDVGWHDSTIDPMQGAFAVVALGGGYDDLLGQVLRVRFGGREVFVYVNAMRSIPVPLSLARRAFFPTLALLARESIRCIVDVVE